MNDKPTETLPKTDGANGVVSTALFGVWSPIETASKTRRSCLVFCPENLCQFMVYWDDYENDWRHFGTGHMLQHRPTHWMPLPPSPNNKLSHEAAK